MDRSQEVIDRALAVVAASRARRERQDRQRMEVFSRIQVASAKKPRLPKGFQMSFDLSRDTLRS